MSDLDLQLAGYGLTTANILYRLPEYPDLLQSFVWQFYDLPPDHPRLFKFLDFWRAEIDGRIHSVEIAHEGRIRPVKFTLASFEGRLH